ncbi:MAG: hypothetical protein K0S65_2416 [Labilithrix sp.]|nr:hypothetical protein [Labilithrix sp.]
MNHLFLLGAAGLLAGAMNALAGGGSFVSLPALIGAGVPSVLANASSTVALFPGGLTSAWVYRSGGQAVGPVAMRTLLAATLLGGAVGAALLLRTPSKTFDRVLPWLLLIAFVALGFGRKLGGVMRKHWQVRPNVVVGIQFLLGIYGGYFGGAVGIMMLAMWGLLDSRDMKSLNAPRTLMVSAANAMAVLVFIVSHAVQWPETAVMLVAAAAGGYGGAWLGRRLPAQAVRVGTLVLTGAMTVAFFARAYRFGF